MEGARQTGSGTSKVRYTCYWNATMLNPLTLAALITLIPWVLGSAMKILEFLVRLTHSLAV